MPKARMIFNATTTQPKEEYVEIKVPKSTYDLFNAVMDKPITGPTEDFLQYHSKSRVINDEMYPFPEIFEDKGHPRGSVVSGTLANSVFYPGTSHDYWVYTPAQYKQTEPANLIVLFDGSFYMKDYGAENPASTSMLITLFDNLIAEAKIPVSIVLFAGFGVPGPGQPINGFAEGEVNRSLEYDTTSDWNARFLTEELMPIALADYAISADPADHVICGISSSGMAAFSTAWFKPDYFGKVYLGSATFANIRNGIVWPYAIRACEKRAIKVFATVGRHDADSYFGNTFNSNYDVACALRFREYEHRLYITEAGHNGRIYMRFMPEGLAWLFNDTEPEMPNCELATYAELLR